MKTGLRPALALVLCAALCISLFPPAFADSEASALPDITAIQNSVVFSDPVATAATEEGGFLESGELTLTLETGFLGAGDGEFVVPAAAATIEDEAFAGCVGMKSVVIPAGVTEIGTGAFSGCDNLIQVQFGGTAAQWEGITIGANNEPLKHAVIFTADGVPVIEDVFPDDSFRAFVSVNIDKDGDGWLDRTEINSITMINCAGTADNRGSIRSLRGIELFANLEQLYCTYNELPELDLSKNTKLRLLACSNNRLPELDLSKNTALEKVYAHYNNLTALNTERNTKLTGLYLAYNSLTGLALTKNTSLRELEVLGNKITSLDLRANTALEALYCANNQLASLKVESTKLKTLDCHGNDLTALDISKTTALEQLNCADNLLTSLNIGQCQALQNVVNTVTPRTTNGIVYYYVDSNKPYLIYDDSGSSTGRGVPITAANFPDNTFRAGVFEYYDKNRDGYLSAAEARAVKTMHFGEHGMGIKTLKGIEYFTSLVYLHCQNNPLYELDISTLSDLKTLECQGTYIESLNISNNVYLRGLIFNTSAHYLPGVIYYSYGTDYLLKFDNDVTIYY